MSYSNQQISKMSREELLRQRLCDLPLHLSVPWFEQSQREITAPLKKRKLAFRPHFWISDEWFCPDGTTGIAIPFFLLHPRLETLEKEMMGFVDGASLLQRKKILRHELGHAVDNAFGLRRRGGIERISVFGDWKKPYPNSYKPMLYSRSFVRHLGDGYAQSHPDEDFAETFAVWLGPKRQWKEKYQSTRALEKLQYMDQLMKRLRGEAPQLVGRRELDSIFKSRMTLREYYRRKKRKYHVNTRENQASEFSLRLQRRLPRSVKTESKLKVEILLRENGKKLLRRSSQRLQAPMYQIQPFHRQCLKLCREQNLRVNCSARKNLEKTLEEIFIREAEKFLKQGGARITL